jgi:hypothetical protein
MHASLEVDRAASIIRAAEIRAEDHAPPFSSMWYAGLTGILKARLTTEVMNNDSLRQRVDELEQEAARALAFRPTR